MSFLSNSCSKARASSQPASAWASPMPGLLEGQCWLYPTLLCCAALFSWEWQGTDREQPALWIWDPLDACPRAPSASHNLKVPTSHCFVI